MPAKRPFECEYDSISADSCASVAAVAERPTGPAAIEASVPSVVLLRSSLSAPLPFITNSTSSVDCAPAWKPALPFVSCMKIGGPHLPFECRQLITPEPDSPPTMNATFFNDGITSTQLALLQTDSGMSDEFRNSLSTAVALLRSLISPFESAPNARVAVSRPVVPTTIAIVVRIDHLPRRVTATGGPADKSW